MMKRKAFILWIVALVLLPLAVYGAGNRATTSTSGKPEISLTILDRGRTIDGGSGTYADNWWVRWINENSPVNVRFVPVLRTEAVQRINALFAAGTAPDVVYEYGRPFMTNLFHQGVLQPVGDHVNRYSTAYKNYLAQHPEIHPYLLADDGQMYGMSSRRGITELYIFGWYIRKDWLDKFNMAVPTTTDQLLTFMRRVRDEDPDGNGQRDTIGIVFNNAYLMTDMRAIFGAPYRDFLVENGRYVDWTSTQGYRDYLSFMALLYSEGLMDAEFITDAQNQRSSQFLTTGRAGVYFGNRPSNGDGFFAKTLARNVPGAEMITMDPPATSYGRFDHWTQDPANYMAVMNRTARNPQAIMSYVDWLVSEGWWNLEFGFEGLHYNLVNNVPITIRGTTPFPELNYTGDMDWVNQYDPQPYWFSTDVDRNDPLSVEWGTKMANFFTRQMSNRPRQYTPYFPTSDRISRFLGETTAQVQALEIQIITGRVSVDEGLRQINALKNNAGWAQVTDEINTWYQRNRNTFSF